MLRFLALAGVLPAAAAGASMPAALVQPAASAVTAVATGDSDLEIDLQAGLERLHQMLPIVSGPLTLDRAERVGVEIILDGRIDAEVSEDEWVQLDAMLPAIQCESMADLIARGAQVTYRLTDSGGENRVLTVTSCPGDGV